MRVLIVAMIVISWVVLAGAQASAPTFEVFYERPGRTADGELPFIGLRLTINGVEITADEGQLGSHRRQFVMRGNVTVVVPETCGEQWRTPSGLYRVGCTAP